MKIIVTGSRVFEMNAQGVGPHMWELEQAVAQQMGDNWDEEYGMPKAPLRLLLGDCKTGMDYIAKEWAINSWVNWQEFEADWLKYGSAAGPYRNQAMVDSGADVCLGFPLVLQSWSGTLDCMTRADEAGIPVFVSGVQWHAEPWMLERRIEIEK